MARSILCALGLLALSSGALAEERFLVEMELWLNGEKHGTPMVIVPAGEEASVSQVSKDGETGWRIELEVEEPAAYEQAPGNALWLHFGIQEKIEGEWEHLADTMMGVPEGRTATMSVVEGEVGEATPDNSIVYLTAKTSRLRPGEKPEP